VTNNDNAGCSTSNFDLQTASPAGWAAAFGASTLAIDPGASRSTTLQVTSSSSAADGFYTIPVTANNAAEPTYAGSTSATIVVASSLTVGVSTDKSSYTRNQQVTVTASVSFQGSPVSGAAVTFAITKSNGTVVTGSATTGTNGSAVYKLRLKKQDPVGTYTVTADANLNNAVFGQGTKSFAVQ
jgi:hypothetical protein